jgi:DNA helicase II / ATP-dependent DNA helicase PcrA
MGLQKAARKAVAEKVVSAKVCSALQGLFDLLDAIKTMPPAEAIETVVERANYLEYLKQYTNSASMDYTAKVENIEQLVHAASQKDSLVEYLEEAALIREDKEDEPAADRGVNLSTIHAAKGLEFDTVFVAGCEENLFPHWKSQDTMDDLQEERRLMYVAMTRAKERLYLTSTDFRKGQYNRKSRFLYEIEDALTQDMTS